MHRAALRPASKPGRTCCDDAATNAGATATRRTPRPTHGWRIDGARVPRPRCSPRRRHQPDSRVGVRNSRSTAASEYGSRTVSISLRAENAMTNSTIQPIGPKKMSKRREPRSTARLLDPELSVGEHAGLRTDVRQPTPHRIIDEHLDLRHDHIMVDCRTSRQQHPCGELRRLLAHDRGGRERRPRQQPGDDGAAEHHGYSRTDVRTDGSCGADTRSQRTTSRRPRTSR